MALDPITAGFNFGSEVVQALEKWIPDPNARMALLGKMQEEVMAAAQASDTTQAQIMAAEAAQKGLINKPHLAMAWVCVLAVVLDLLIGQVVWLSYALGHPFPEPPKFFTDQIGTYLTGLFGLSSLTVAHGLTKQWMATP